MQGKDKCRMLREIRQQIAKQNDIELITADCGFKGECRGTCPKCESELKYLEQQLEIRRSLGKRIALVGLAAGTALTMTGCSLTDAIDDVTRAAGEIKKNICPAPQPPEPDYIMGDFEIVGEIADWNYNE